MADNLDLLSDNEKNDNDNDQQDHAAQEQSETDNDNDDNDDEESSKEEEQIVDQGQDLKPQVEQETEQILDQEGQESIDRQLQEEIAGTSRIDKGKEAQIQIEPARVRYSTALPHLLLFIIFLISHVYCICYFLLSIYGHQDNAGTLSHVISVNYRKR